MDTEVAIRILVIDRGFVLVGRCIPPETVGLWLTVTDCRVIRRWGTTQGLGELINGPTANTMLDAMVAKETIPVRAVLRVLEVDQAGWEPHLSAAPAAPRRRATRATA